MTNEIDNILKLNLRYKKPPINEESYKSKIKEINYYCPSVNKNTLLSFLIVAYDEGDLVFRLLETIFCSKSKEYEVVIVDNGLSEKTRNKLKNYTVTHVISTDNVGLSTGRNIGSMYCNSPILYFVDADGYLDNIDISINKAKYFNQNDNLVAITGKVKEINKPFFKFNNCHYDLGDSTFSYFPNVVGNTLIRRRDFINVGGFEDAFYSHEGLVLCFRMIEVYGYRLDSFIYDPKLIIFHDYPRSYFYSKIKMIRDRALNHKLLLEYPLITYLRSDYNRKRLKILGISKKGQTRENLFSRLINKYIDAEVDKEFVKELRNYNKNKRGGEGVNFSVVITSYNLGKYIRKAIDSIENQTLENVEILIIDDCSDDEETIEVLNEMSKRYKVIKLDVNSGVSVARNTGIQNSKSEYICTLDADDYLGPTYLEKAKNIFDNYSDVGIVSCYSKAFGYGQWKFKPKNDVDIVTALVENPIHSESCFRKKASLEVGMFDKELRSHEDWDHWLKILKNNWKLKVIPEYFMNYRYRNDSLFRSTVINADFFCSRIIDNHKELYEKHYSEVFSKKHLRLTKLRKKFRYTNNTLFVRLSEFLVKSILSRISK